MLGTLTALASANALLVAFLYATRAVAEVSAAWHATGMMRPAALLVATSWTIAPRKQRPGGPFP